MRQACIALLYYSVIQNKKKAFILSVTNAIIKLLWSPAKLFSKRISISDSYPKTILLVRLDHIGDVIMTSPAISAIRERFPDSKILLVSDAASAQLFAGDPRLDDIIVFNWPWPYQEKNNKFTASKVKELARLITRLRKEEPDLCIDFRGDLRFVFLFGILTGAKLRIGNSRMGDNGLLDNSSVYDVSKHEVERALDVVSCIAPVKENVRPVLCIEDTEVSSMKRFVEEETGTRSPNKIAVVAPYSSKAIKSWPAANFRQVISHLSSKGFTVLVVGTKDDRIDAEEMINGLSGNIFSFSGKTSVRELAVLVSISALVVGIDTGVLHIASCFNVPIVAIFGPTRSVEFSPYSPHAVVVDTGTCQCNQFAHLKCDCPVMGYARCLVDLMPWEIISRIDNINAGS